MGPQQRLIDSIHEISVSLSNNMKYRYKTKTIADFILLDMDYEFLVRTADNVEIILDVSIFWQITDLYKLVLVTEDPPQDICNFIPRIQGFFLIDDYFR